MSYVVDTCLLIDVLFADKHWARASAKLIAKHLDEDLLICPISVIELAPAFSANAFLQSRFLEGLGVSADEIWTAKDTEAASLAWCAYARERKGKPVAKRPIADILIGAFASRFDGLLTRNGVDFRPWFPRLKILAPR